MLGLSTYAYVWRRRREHGWEPLSLTEILEDAGRHGVGVLQLCDVPELDDPEPGELAGLRARAQTLGVTLEVGTRGVEPTHLDHYLSVAGELGATFCRSMLSSARSTPSLRDAVAQLREIVPAFEERGVVLGLETYEQFATRDLLDVVEQVGSPHLGIVLDPGNSVARLEHPMDVVRACAPHVVNLHVKDFAFTRKEGTIGFTFAGAPLGTGLLDYPSVCDELDRHGRKVNHIVEHWLTRQDDLASTRALETRWVSESLDHLRALNRS